MDHESTEATCWPKILFMEGSCSNLAAETLGEQCSSAQNHILRGLRLLSIVYTTRVYAAT